MLLRSVAAVLEIVEESPDIISLTWQAMKAEKLEPLSTTEDATPDFPKGGERLLMGW